MYRWVILRHHRLDCSDGIMCSRLILTSVLFCVLKLLGGYIFILFIFKQLLELSRGLLSSLDGIVGVYGMYRRLVLRHHGPD